MRATEMVIRGVSFWRVARVVSGIMNSIEPVGNIATSLDDFSSHGKKKSRNW